jgi:oxygen-independent coproporphyrinogen-3 oxidase
LPVIQAAVGNTAASGNLALVPQPSTDALPAGAVVADDAIPRETAMVETAMVSLRLVEGLDLAAFAARFGCPFDAVFGERLADVRALGLLEETDGYLRLTEQGRLLGNEVFMRLLPDA